MTHIVLLTLNFLSEVAPTLVVSYDGWQCGVLCKRVGQAFDAFSYMTCTYPSTWCIDLAGIL